MAQAPTSRRLGLTRDQLSAFLQNHEQIKQFENLFATVDSEVATSAVTDATTLAGNAYAIGNEALAGIAALNDLVAPLAAAPPPTGGTVTSVAASGGTTGMTFSGSPITTSGTLVLGGTLGFANGGTGLTATPANGQLLIGNSAGYTLATLTAGTAISVGNAAGAITITNTAPDQIVSLTGAGTTVITGTYPSFTITSNDAFVGTVTSVSVVSANGFAGTVASSTTTPAITISTSVSGIIKGNGTAISAASAGTDYVAPGAYTTSGLTMATSRLLGRTTATTGAAEEISVAGGLTLSGGVLTGTSGTVTSVTGTSPVVSSGGATPAISMPAATTSVSGYLTSTDWTTFNNKGSGSVTSVSGTGTVNGITLTGTVTTSGSLTLGGTLSGVSLTTQVSGTLPVANGGTGATSLTSGYLVKGNGTSAASASVVYDDGTNIGIGLSTLASGYAPGNSSLNMKNSSSVLWQNAAGSWNTTTNGAAVTYYSDNNLYIDAKDSASNIIFRVNGATERARITNNGYFLVNETTASAVSLNHNFEVNGDIMSTGTAAGLFWGNRSVTPSLNADWYGWYTTASTIFLYNPAVGNIASINVATGAYVPLSDEAKKKDFEPSTVGLDAIMGLEPKLFRMKTDSDDAAKQLGFIAQEVKDHIPQAYLEEKNTDASGSESVYIGLSDRPIIAALVKAVQELKAELDEIKGR